MGREVSPLHLCRGIEHNNSAASHGCYQGYDLSCKAEEQGCVPRLSELVRLTFVKDCHQSLSNRLTDPLHAAEDATISWIGRAGTERFDLCNGKELGRGSRDRRGVFFFRTNIIWLEVESVFAKSFYA